MAEHVSFLTREIFILYFYIYLKFTLDTRKLNMDCRASNIVIASISTYPC